MFKYASAIAISICLVTPAAANEQIARKAGVPVGEYSLAEMVQLMQLSGSEHKQRLELIHKARERFAAQVSRLEGSANAAFRLRAASAELAKVSKVKPGGRTAPPVYFRLSGG